MQCNSPKSKCLPSFTPKRPLESFQDIVQDYIVNRRSDVLNEFKWLKSIKDHSELIRIASYALQSDNNRSSHHYRKQSKLLDDVYKCLTSQSSQIMRQTSFDAAYCFLRSIIGGVQGIGPLYLYDTTLVLCAGRGYFPDRIYLHSGTTRGARALGLKTNRDWIDKQELPKEFRRLHAYELEDVLCIYEDVLKRIVARGEH